MAATLAKKKRLSKPLIHPAAVNVDAVNRRAAAGRVNRVHRLMMIVAIESAVVPEARVAPVVPVVKVVHGVRGVELALAHEAVGAEQAGGHQQVQAMR
jgi:hypothetical protein